MNFSNIKFSDNPNSYLAAYIHSPFPELRIGKRKAIVVCPGGGYRFLSERESEPVALQYFAAGLNVFVLYYPINQHAANYEPLIEACLKDLARVGIAESSEEDPLVVQAVVLYCKANFGFSDGQERYQAAYESLRDSMALSGDYGGGSNDVS